MKTLLTLVVGFGLICSSLVAQTNELPAVSPQLYSRGFHLDPEDLSRLRSQVPPIAGETTQDFLMRYLKMKHVDINAPESLRFEPRQSVLFVRATLAKLDKVESLLSEPKSKD